MKARFLVWLMSTRFYRFLLKYVIPEIQFFHAPGPGYFVKENIRLFMLPGDILLSKSNLMLTNLLIGGKYSHAAIVLEKDKIAEMSANGFDVKNVNDFSKKTTRIALLRYKNTSNNYGEAVAKKAMEIKSADYDYCFDLSNNLFYCSELVYYADFENRGMYDLSDLVGVGKPYLSPVGVYEAKGLRIVYEWQEM